MDLVIINGDQAIFDPAFGPAVVTAPPGTITGSGRGQVHSAAICVEGDEATVVVAGAAYVAPSFPQPGVGTVTIESLAPDQKSRKDKSTGRALILRGVKFRARFQVTAPATHPGGGIDGVPLYSGTGSFVTANMRVRAE